VLSLGGGRGYGVKRAGKAISCLLTCFFSSICCYLQDNVTYRFCLRSFKVPGEGKTDIAVPSLGGGRGYDVKRALSHLFFLLHLLLFTREAISCLFTCFFSLYLLLFTRGQGKQYHEIAFVVDNDVKRT